MRSDDLHAQWLAALADAGVEILSFWWRHDAPQAMRLRKDGVECTADFNGGNAVFDEETLYLAIVGARIGIHIDLDGRQIGKIGAPYGRRAPMAVVVDIVSALRRAKDC